jgi:hypothetical protein
MFQRVSHAENTPQSVVFVNTLEAQNDFSQLGSSRPSWWSGRGLAEALGADLNS